MLAHLKIRINPERTSNKLVFEHQILCSDKHFVWGENVSKCKLFEGVVENRSSSSSRLMRSGARTLLLHQARLTPTSAEPGLELRPNTNTNTRQIKALSHQAQLTLCPAYILKSNLPGNYFLFMIGTFVSWMVGSLLLSHSVYPLTGHPRFPLEKTACFQTTTEHLGCNSFSRRTLT